MSLEVTVSGLTTLKVPEKSTMVICGSFEDELGVAMIPDTVTWSLASRDGTIINSREDVNATPGTTVDFVLSGDDLAVTDEYDCKRIFSVSGTYTSSYGSGLPLTEHLEFEIIPDRLVS